MANKPFMLLPDWPSMPANVGALATTRRGGVSLPPYDDGQGGGGFNLGMHCGDNPEHVKANRAQLDSVLPGRPAWTAQVHGVAVADSASVAAGEPATADAGVSSQPGVVCAILTADCLPVLFADMQGRVVGAAHAGWRGLAAGVLGETVKAMRARGADAITAWMGPAIGPTQFEVGDDVLQAFVAGAGSDAARVRDCFAPFPGRPGKYLADMFTLARITLAREGVTDVAGGTHCTATERATFFSYRRDHVTGRQASLIWLGEA